MIPGTQEGRSAISAATILSDLYEGMNRHFGDLHWWPGESPLEIMIGAILTQNTSWRNVEKAIRNLKEQQFIQIEKILQAAPERIEELIRPAGFFRLKTERLRNLLFFIKKDYKGSLERMFEEDVRILRKKLLQVRGIGEETADSILLYAGGKPVFVIDAYTRRVLLRHRLIREDMTYGELQRFFMDHLSRDATLYNQYHALFVELGKSFCTKVPQCDACPLRAFAPRYEPIAIKIAGEGKCYLKSEI